MKGMHKAVNAKSSWIIIDIIVQWLGVKATLWAGDGCVASSLDQTSETSLTVDMVARKLLGFLEDAQTHRTSDFFL